MRQSRVERCLSRFHSAFGGMRSYQRISCWRRNVFKFGAWKHPGVADQTRSFSYLDMTLFSEGGMAGESIVAESAVNPGRTKGAVAFFREWQEEDLDMKMVAEKPVEPGASVSARLGIGSWTVLVVLFLLLAVTFMVVYLGWTMGSGTDVPASGYVAMALGVIVSLAVGFGLMALIFYSSRNGYDEQPVLIAPEGEADEPADVPPGKP
jgi:hypothetical protein